MKFNNNTLSNIQRNHLFTDLDHCWKKSR